MKSSALVRRALALSLIMWSQVLFAATYNLTISGTHTANLILTAGAPGASSIVTAVSGTFDGQTVTGLTNLCGANNAFNISGQLGFFTNYGIGFTYGNGSDFVALWTDDGISDALPGPINNASVNCGAYDVVTSSVSTLTVIPVPTVTTQYNILITGTHTANLTLTAGAPGASSLVTAVSGTFDGQTVTGFNNLCQASNVINSAGSLGFVDYGGIGVTYGSGSDYVNLWFTDQNYLNGYPPGPINFAKVNCNTRDSVTSSASIYDASPTVTSISTGSGSTLGGRTIIITGTNLMGATGITVGGVACSNFSVSSSTTATCTAPAGSAGTASVLVTTSSGTSSANTLFTYVAPATQATLMLTASQSSINVNGTSGLSTSGGSGSGSVSFSLVSGPCTLSGATVTGTGAGRCIVTATKPSDGTYASATSAQVTVTVLAPTPTLTFTTTTSASVTMLGSLTNAATSSLSGGSYGAISYTSSNNAVATVNSSGLVAPVSEGTATITATQAAVTGVNAQAAQTYALTVSLASQTITASASASSINTGSTANIATSGGSGSGALSYSSSNSSFATVNASGVVTGVSAGSVTITVTKAADTNYAAATTTVIITIALTSTTTVTTGSTVSLSSLGVTANPVLAGGTLVLSNGNSSSLSIAIISSGGTIQTPSSGSATLSGALTGSGGLTFTGTGTTVLTGSNTYSGGTTVASGTLQGNTSSMQGSITNNGRVVFDQPGTGTFSGTIAGSGAVVLQNTGTVVLSGSNSYSGGTTVSGGTLSVAGSSPTGTGDVVVASAGTLMGTGTISGNVNVAGVFKPGNSPGYLSILSNFTLNSNSTYVEDIAGTAQSSSTTPVGATGYYAVLNVGGPLIINSGVTLTTRLSNLFTASELGYGSAIYVPALGDVFRIARASGGISGQFATLTQPAELTSGTQLLAFYNVNNSNSLDLAVVPTSYSARLFGGTPTVVSAANVLDQWVVLNKAGTATATQNQVLLGVASQTAANLPAYVQAHLTEILGAENAPIPTLSEWAMIFMSSLMGMFAFMRNRRA